jgi:hypothetical protein
VHTGADTHTQSSLLQSKGSHKIHALLVTGKNASGYEHAQAPSGMPGPPLLAACDQLWTNC